MKNTTQVSKAADYENMSESDLLALDDLHQDGQVLTEIVVRFQFDHLGEIDKDGINKINDILRRIRRAQGSTSALMALYWFSATEESCIGDMDGIRALQSAAERDDPDAIEEMKRLRMNALILRDFVDATDRMDSGHIYSQVVSGVYPFQPTENRLELLRTLLGVGDLNVGVSPWVGMQMHPNRSGLYTLGHEGIIAGVGVFDVESGAWLVCDYSMRQANQWRGFCSKTGAPDPMRLISAELVAAIRAYLDRWAAARQYAN